MPSPKALAVSLSERQQYLLEQIAGRRTNPYRLVQRAQSILFAAFGINNTEIGQQLQLHRHQVRYWRQRWQESSERLHSLEREGISDQALTQQMLLVLSDEQRPGGPAKFSVEQIVQIVAVACELPECSERPISHWTPRELASEVVKRGIVETISPRSVGRFLKRGKESNRIAVAIGDGADSTNSTEFKQQVDKVCQLHLQAPELAA